MKNILITEEFRLARFYK